MQKEINIYPSGAYKHPWEDPAQGTLKPSHTDDTVALLNCYQFFWYECEALWGDDSSSKFCSVAVRHTFSQLLLLHQLWLFYSKMPKVCWALLFQECKNYTLKGYLPLFCTYWTDLADSDISFLLFTPASRKGHTVTCTPKSFCTTVECDFFSHNSLIFLSQKSSTWNT